MILMHAMAAPYAIPGIGISRGDTMYHLLSDIPGPAGTTELLAFVRACGGHDAWIQSAGTYREHFDIFGEFAEIAQELGAQPATNAAVAAVLSRKRATQGDPRLPVAALTTRQKRAVLSLMQRQGGITAEDIAARAAPHVTTMAQRLLGGDIARKHIILLIGTPYDALGIACASELARAGMAVTLASVGATPTWSDGQQSALTKLAVTMITRPDLNASDLQGVDLLIDRLLPWEHATTPTTAIAHAIATVNASGVATLAIDAPAGLDTDPDEYRSHLPWLGAAATLVLGVPLRGLTMRRATPVIGDLWLADVGIPRRTLKQVGLRLGPVFDDASLVRLAAVPLGDAAGEIVRWVVVE